MFVLFRFLIYMWKLAHVRGNVNRIERHRSSFNKPNSPPTFVLVLLSCSFVSFPPFSEKERRDRESTLLLCLLLLLEKATRFEWEGRLLLEATTPSSASFALFLKDVDEVRNKVQPCEGLVLPPKEVRSIARLSLSLSLSEHEKTEERKEVKRQTWCSLPACVLLFPFFFFCFWFDWHQNSFFLLLSFFFFSLVGHGF